MRVFQIVGYQNTGKTTLVCKLIERLRDAGYRVGTIKHDAHEFEMDHENKDTWKHGKAGAEMVSIISSSGAAVIAKHPLSLEQMLDYMLGLDFVLVEGFKHESFPKIVLVKEPSDFELVIELQHVIAAAAWPQMLEAEVMAPYPLFAIDDVEGMFQLLINLPESSK